ncbi:MAG: DUF1028 domain-containing protein [Acidobacteria bacterium]|nr:DUF1028 domain-containing protein [Acidobacteriota bacterium]
MRHLRTAVLTALLTVAATPAFATWSVIALDRSTGSLVIASATCVTDQGLRSRGGLKNIQAIVVPGKGIAAAQANVDGTHANQMLIFNEMQKGTAPADIIAMLKADPRIESRQFAILDLQGRSAGFSGSGNGATSLDVQGQVPGTEIFYSIQGNILKAPVVVNEAEKAFVTTTGALTDRVMAAMELADASGGDSRCSCARGPATAATAACHARSAYVAYILRAETADTNGESHSDGKYSMFIDVTDANIEAHENPNPVKTLRMRYDAYMKAGTRF